MTPTHSDKIEDRSKGQVTATSPAPQIPPRSTSALATATAVSIVVPTLNEEPNIAELLVRIYRVFRQLYIPYEVLLVDDHSTDNTVAVARRVAEARGLPLRTLVKQGQRGKSFSLMEGFAQARYPILGMIDADLQYPPEAFADMLHALTDADIVVSDRRANYASLAPWRGQLSALFNRWIASGIFGLNMDIQAGMKLFDQRVYTSFTLHPTEWSFDLDLLARAQHAGHRIISVPIAYGPRQAGASKVHTLEVGLQLVLAAIRLRLWFLLGPLASSLTGRGMLPQAQRDIAAREEPLEAHAAAADVGKIRQWLVQRAAVAASDPHEHIARAFHEAASQADAAGGEDEHSFAVLAPEHSARRTFTRAQLSVLALLLESWAVGFLLFTTPTLALAIILITLIYTKNLIDMTRMSLKALARDQQTGITDELIDTLRDEEWPRYTILCPLYHEVEVVPQFVSAMQALDYPTNRLQVLFLTEEDDRATTCAIEELRLPSHFEILVVPAGRPQTKPRACNFGLMHATGEYIVIYDAEDVPDPRQLKKAVLAFAHGARNMACAQAKLNFYNVRQNLLTRLFAIEYTFWFELLLPGLQRAGMSLPLGGTSNHFPAALLRKLGGWDPFNVTEDCDLGLRLAHHRLHTVVLDSMTLEEANSNVRNWIRQRSRWIKGYLQTYLVHMRRPYRYMRKGRLREFLSLQFIIGGTPATFFINPLMWAMLGVYIAVRPLVEETYHQLYPGPIFYLGVFCFVFGNYLCVCLSMLACYSRQEYGLMKWTLLLPAYWFMMSVAAIVAVTQLIWKPHYWEKTRHGLHLSQRRRREDTRAVAPGDLASIPRGS